MFRKLVLCVFVVAMSAMSLSVSALNLPTKEINGKSYYYYEVQPKETIYSLCKQLGVTKDEIVKYNPAVADGLRANQMLYFPVAAYNKDAATTVVTERHETLHSVSRGETIYGICKSYGITSQQLFELNPDAANGLKEGMTLKIPVIKTKHEVKTTFDGVSDNGYVYHSITKGESLYSIANSYNTTVEELLELNPGLSPDNYRSGITIRLRPNTVKVQTEEPKEESVPTEEYTQYTVKKNETIYSIAQKNNLTVAAIENANPDIEGVKKGQIINLPQTSSGAKEQAPIEEAQPTTPEPSLEEVYEDVHGKTEISEMRIAVMLPFMLSQEKPAKQAMLYTDFYKGFLIAVDSLRNIGTPIHITTFDTADNIDTINQILANPEMKSMNVIIAPDDEEQLAAIAAFGKENNCNVLNIFAVKSTLYRDNDHIMQANIPHSMMYSKAIEGLVKELKGATPIFLAEEKGRDDKAEFISTLKQLLDTKGITYQEIVYTDYLKEENLTGIDRNGKYVFIPVSGHPEAFHHVANSLRELKETMGNPYDLRLFGYPEWTTLRGESLERMHSLNTTIYSRFYNDAESSRAQELEAKFKQWYGQPMMTAVPMQGTLGFDTGMYLIKALDRNRGDFNDDNTTYHGIQSCYNFRRPTSWSGLVNETLYFITFSPGGVVTKEEVK